MIELVQARYIGLDGSLGYRVNQTYHIMLETNPHGPEIVVKTSEGGGRCPYDSALAFLRNWADVKVDPDPAKPPIISTAVTGTPPELAGRGLIYHDSKGKGHVITELTEPHLINIARKLWRTGNQNESITAELKRRNINIKEHLTKEDLE